MSVSVIAQRQQDQLKEIRRQQAVKDKQAFDKCIAFWDKKFEQK